MRTPPGRLRERLIQTLFAIAGIVTILTLVGIFLFIFSTGIKAFSEISLSEFFGRAEWNPTAFGEPRWGILALLAGTVMVTAGALVVALPLGLAGAIYLSEIARPAVREVVKPLIEMIAGIPSVVLGLVGVLFLSPLVASLFGLNIGLNAFTASLIVAVMVLPTIMSISEDILTSLPSDFREASLALGATQWQMIRMTLLPSALSGLLAAVMLGVGRAVGETMAVLMVAGNALAFPHSYLGPVRPITANIAIEIKEVVRGGLHYEALFALGLVLFVLTFVINFIADIIIERYARKFRW